MTNPIASIIIIGNEILSGRTLDKNTQSIALELGKIGILVKETRIIPDDKDMIIQVVREFSDKYDYVFTTGGIGPTHDDITSESIASAFNLPYSRNEEIYQILKEYYSEIKEKLNSSREKMAYVPQGAKLIYNDATRIPGFVIKNVYSMAGIPKIMQAMLDSVVKTLKHGKIIKEKSIKIMIGEGRIADQFASLQNEYPSVDMGSYPFTENDVHGTILVLRSIDYISLENAYKQLEIICKEV